MLRTCRQIYIEAISILYAENEFVIFEPKSWFRFFNQIGVANLKFIQRLDFVLSWIQLREFGLIFDTLAKEASGLQSIEYAYMHNTTMHKYSVELRGPDAMLALERARDEMKKFEAAYMLIKCSANIKRMPSNQVGTGIFGHQTASCEG
jgi:hypothetical protein